MNESAFQEAVVQEAQLAGFLVYHTHDSRRSAAGFPDLVLVKRPLVIFAELKRPGGQPSPEQCEWLEELQHCDQIETRLWRPCAADWSEIDGLVGMGAV